MTEIEVNNPERFAELTEIARRVGDDDDIVPTLFAALEEYIDDAEEQSQKVAEARDRCRDRLGLESGGNTFAETSEHRRRSDDVCDDVTAKQEELREKHFN